MKHRYAIDVLRHIGGENAHRELLVVVIRIDLAELHKGPPVDADGSGIVAQEVAHHSIVEGVVACRYRGVGCEEA